MAATPGKFTIDYSNPPLALAIAAIAIGAFLLPPAHADTITWTNTSSGDWGEPMNWSPNQVPGAGDTVTIGGYSAIRTVTINSSVSVGAMTVWWGASITVAPGATLNLAGLGLTWIQGSLTNSGTINWQGGRLVFDADDNGNLGRLSNLPGALFDIQCDQPIDYSHSYYPFISNAGLIRKSAGTGTNIVSVVFNNTGTVNVQSGNLQFSGVEGQMSGQYQADPGAKILFDSGTYTLVPAPVLTGNGAIKAIGRILKFSGAFSGHLDLEWSDPANSCYAITHLTVLSNAVLNILGSGGKLIEGDYLTIAAGGTLNLPDSGYIQLYSQLTNCGTINWQGGMLVLDADGNAAFWNLPGALFDIQCNQPINYSHAYSPFIANSGLVRKSAGTGTNLISVVFNNTGIVNVQSGSLQFSGGQMSGRYQAELGTQILCGVLAYAYTLDPAPTLNGGGFIGIAGANVNLNGAFTGHLELNGGTITTTGLTVKPDSVLSVYGNATSTFNGNLYISTNGVLTLSGPGPTYFFSALTNNGLVLWQGGGILVDAMPGYQGAIWNQPGAEFDIQCDQWLNQTYYYPAPFNNAGLVRKRYSTGTNLVAISFNNAGTLELDTGWFRLLDGNSLPGANGNYSPGANSVLAFALTGPTAGTNYGQLLVDGTATLVGTINAWLVNNYLPATNTVFTNVIAGNLQGKFDNDVAFISPAGQPFIPVYRNHMVLLQGVSSPQLYDAGTAPDGSFQFAFTNLPGAPFTVLAATNVTQPLSQWTRVLGLEETPPGQFQFTDPDATNYPARFYRVRSP